MDLIGPSVYVNHSVNIDHQNAHQIYCIFNATNSMNDFKQNSGCSKNRHDLMDTSLMNFVASIPSPRRMRPPMGRAMRFPLCGLRPGS